MSQKLNGAKSFQWLYVMYSIPCGRLKRRWSAVTFKKIKMVLKLLLLKQQPIYHWCACLVTQSRLTFYNPVECSPPGFSIFSRGNTRLGCHLLLQRIFPTHGLNLHHLYLLHCWGFFTCWATREALMLIVRLQKIEVMFLILSYEPAQALLTTHLPTLKSVRTCFSFICHLLLRSCH